MQHTPLKRVPFKKKPRKVSKAKKETFVQLRAVYGLPDGILGPSSLRYRQPVERGILWYWFSRFIREIRDAGKTCISCDKEKEDYQGGHFVPTGKAGWDEFVFDERNVHAECSNCNHQDKRKLSYGINLDKRYGKGTKDALEQRYDEYKSSTGHKNWGREAYIQKIAHYKSLIEKETTG